MLQLWSWAENLRREMDAPDLWAQAISGGPFQIGASTSEEDNSKFTATEMEQIKESLKEIRAGILALRELSAEQTGIIDRGLLSVERAAARLGRFDWRNLFLGVIFQMIVEAGLTLVAGQIGTIATNAFSWFVVRSIFPSPGGKG